MSLDKLKAKVFKNPEVKEEYDKLDWEFKLRISCLCKYYFYS
ncbi:MULTISPECIES: hypothetical protein [Francisella]|nr:MULTISPECIES: hypothetical protein [Francisella]APC91555.1 hypothetical protein BBG19_0819 [Francisella sp. MA067296]